MLRPSLLVVGILALLAWAPAPAALTWEPIGPDGGDRFMVKISPCSSATLFVLGYHAIHRSLDAAESWTLTIDPGMTADSFLDIAFAGASCQELYVAGATTGVWYSPDEGASWQPRGQGLPAPVGELDRFPVTSLVRQAGGTLFAALSGSPHGTPPPRAVYRSDDGGMNWFPDGFGIPSLGTLGSVVTLLSVDAAARPWAVVHGAGVYVYADGSWQDRNGNLPGDALLATFLANDPLDPERLLLGTESAWVFETRNAGQSWARMPLPAALSAAPVLPLVYAVGIDPNNAQFILVRAFDASGSLEQPLFDPLPEQTEGAGLYLSADGGATWVRQPRFLFRIAVDSSQTVEDEVLGAGTVLRSRTWYLTGAGRSSFVKSSDGFTTFEQKCSGIRTLWMDELWVHPHPPPGSTRMVFAASEAGLFRMSDDPANGWLSANSSDRPVYTWSFAEDFAHPDTVLYATGNPAWSTPEWRGVFRLPLECFDTPCPPAEHQLLSSTGLWRLVTTPAVPGRIVAAGQEEGVLVSDDGGSSWLPFNEGISLPASLTDVVLDTNGDPRWASFRTSSGDWLATPTGPEQGGVYAFDPVAGRWSGMAGLSSAVFHLEQAADGSLLAAAADGVYRFRPADGWLRISPQVACTGVAVDPLRPAYIYAATRTGIYRTTNDGSQWHKLSDGLSVQSVSALAVDSVDGTVYAGVEGGSVLRLRPDPNPRPILSLSHTSLDFGWVPVGFRRRVAVTLTNAGEANLVIDAMTPTNAAFSVEGAPAWPVTITPGSWINLTLAYAPPLAASAAGSMVASGNATNTPLLLPVQGVGYSEKGTISMTVSPSNASWVATTPWGSTIGRTGSATLGNVPTGIYSIEWKPLDGYSPPPNQPAIAMVNVGQTTLVAGTYIVSGGNGTPPKSGDGTGAPKKPVSKSR